LNQTRQIKKKILPSSSKLLNQTDPSMTFSVYFDKMKRILTRPELLIFRRKKYIFWKYCYEYFLFFRL